MCLVKQVLCLIRAAAHIVNALIRVSLLFPWCKTSERRRQVANWSRTTLRIFGLGVSHRVPADHGVAVRLLVANHVSWLDVFAIWSQTDAVFVAKTEVARWPLVGPLARRLGVVFIDRSSRRDAAAVTRVVSKLLAEGRSVCIFPEGTSTDGRALQPFHPALFQSAIDAGVAIQPISLRYFKRDGTNATDAAFTGTMSLAQSMWRLAHSDEIAIEAAYLPIIHSSGHYRRALAHQAHAAIKRQQQQPASGFASAANVSPALNDASADATTAPSLVAQFFSGAAANAKRSRPV